MKIRLNTSKTSSLKCKNLPIGPAQQVAGGGFAALCVLCGSVANSHPI